MYSTGKSNPYTSQICLSTPPALQHCFSAQAGLGGQCPSGQHSSVPPHCHPVPHAHKHRHPWALTEPTQGRKLSFTLLSVVGWETLAEVLEESVFLYKKLNEYVPLTSWVPRCRSSLIPSVNPAAVTDQQKKWVLLLTFYLTEAQVSQAKFLSSKPPVCLQSLLKSPQ